MVRGPAGPGIDGENERVSATQAQCDGIIDHIIADREHIHELLLPSIISSLLNVPLTMGQLKALAIIVSTSPEMSIQNLASDLRVSLATTSGIVERLVQHGMVERHEDEVDHRIRRLGPTDAGRALVYEIASTNRELSRETLNKLTLGDLRALEQGMTAVHSELERATRTVDDPGRHQLA